MPTLRPPRAPKLPALTEKQVTSQCVDWLRSQGWLCVRLQSGLMELPGNRRIRIGTPNLPDWVCLNHDRYFLVEMKAPGKVPNAGQEQWIADARRKGLNVFWADGLGRLMLELEAIWTR